MQPILLHCLVLESLSKACWLRSLLLRNVLPDILTATSDDVACTKARLSASWIDFDSSGDRSSSMDSSGMSSTISFSSSTSGAFSDKVYCASPWTIESQDFQLMLILKF